MDGFMLILKLNLSFFAKTTKSYLIFDIFDCLQILDYIGCSNFTKKT